MVKRLSWFFVILGPEIRYMFGCFDSGDFQVVMEVDGDEVFYVDFKIKNAMWTVPNFKNFRYAQFSELVYLYSNLSRTYCHTNLIQERNWTASFPPNLKGERGYCHLGLVVYRFQLCDEGIYVNN